MKGKRIFFRITAIFGLGIITLFLAGSIYFLCRHNNNPLGAMFQKKQDKAGLLNMDESLQKTLAGERDKLNLASPASSVLPSTQAVATFPLETDHRNYSDILVMGVDSREMQLESQTDSIILFRVDNDNRKFKIISISRDIYLSIPGYTDNRINEACVYGGPELVIKTINQAFDLNIRNYIVFDFKTAEKMIDLVGAVTADIDREELDDINNYINELNGISDGAKNVGLLRHTGSQKLNGRQAVAYARLRPDMGSDFKRMERQKEVLSSLMQSAVKLKPDQVMPLINSALDTLYSNLSIAGFTSLALDINNIKDQYTAQFLTIPIENSYDEVELVEMKYIVIDFLKNKGAIQEFLQN